MRARDLLQALRTQARIARGRLSESKERAIFFDQAHRYSRLVSVDAGGMHFVVPTSDRAVGRFLFAKRRRPELDALAVATGLIDAHVSMSMAARVFLDVGANIGTTTVPALLRHGFDEGIAIEPDLENARILGMNLVANGIYERVQIIRAAISNTSGTATMVRSASNSGDHRVLFEGSVAATGETFQVDQMTLDELVEGGVLDPSRLRLIWLDTQGAEGHVLSGCPRLAATGVPLVFEFFPQLLGEVRGLHLLEDVVAENYTHIAELADSGEAVLRPAGDLRMLCAELAASSRSMTDVIALRIDAR